MACRTSYAVTKAEMEASKEMFEKEKQYLLKEIIGLKEKLGKCSTCVEELEKNAKEYEKQIKELKHNLEVRERREESNILIKNSNTLSPCLFNAILLWLQTQTSETVREFKMRQNCEVRIKELLKQLEQREKEIEEHSFHLVNAKEQIKLFENTVNEQKVSCWL